MDRLFARLRRYPALVSLILGALAACGFAPLEFWPLTLVCFAGWIALVHDAATLKRAAWLGWVFGVGHFTINNNWFQHAFDFQDKMPPVLGYFAAVGLALYLAVYPALAAAIAWKVGRRARPDTAYLLIFAAAWILSEYLRSIVFTGYIWDPLGVIWVAKLGVARIATLTGTYALSGLTIFAAGSLLLLRRRIAVPAGVAIVLAVASVSARWTDAPPPPATGPLLRVVQPNVGLGPDGQPDMVTLQKNLAALSGRPGPRQRIVMWPEGMVREPIENGYPAWVYTADPFYLRYRLAQPLGPKDVLLTGGDALYFDDRGALSEAANTVYGIDSRARIIGRYDKAHLVPYGEYLPIPWLLRPLGLARLVPGDVDFRDGPGPRGFVIPGVGLVGFQICYEIIFSGQVVDKAHRPRLIFNPSNDAWFGTWGPPQHLAQARMRAIEEGLPIVRSTPTGISAVIAADGRLLATVPPNEAGAIEMAIPPALPPTLFSRIGNWMALIVGASMVFVAVAIRRRAR